MPPPVPPVPGYLSPAGTAARLAGALARTGLTGIYTAATTTVAVISVTAEVTAWTDGHIIWTTRGEQRETWPATATGAAVTRLAAMARREH